MADAGQEVAPAENAAQQEAEAVASEQQKEAVAPEQQEKADAEGEQEDDGLGL